MTERGQDRERGLAFRAGYIVGQALVYAVVAAACVAAVVIVLLAVARARS